MVASNLGKFMPVLGLVLVLVIVSMMVVNLLGLNLSDNSGLPILNRLAVFEGMKGENDEGNDNEDEENDIAGMASILKDLQM
jgi:hypothetical protein